MEIFLYKNNIHLDIDKLPALYYSHLQDSNTHPILLYIMINYMVNDNYNYHCTLKHYLILDSMHFLHKLYII